MTSSDKSYLAYMAARLLEMRRVLKPTGSLYLHCDPTMSHYLKLVMDASVRDVRNFRNEIVWQRTSQATADSQADGHTVHDTLSVLRRALDSLGIQSYTPHDPT